jgi:hypothetical protein
VSSVGGFIENWGVTLFSALGPGMGYKNQKSRFDTLLAFSIMSIFLSIESIRLP